MGKPSQLHCRNALGRSAVPKAESGLSGSPRSGPINAPRKVLVVEFRDEVFADLKAIFERQRCEVIRAVSGAAVAPQVKRFAPDLFVINERMPDESGWLITCKLRLTKHHQPVWFYAAHLARGHLDWKDSCGINELIHYGGVLSQLSAAVAERLEGWLGAASGRDLPEERRPPDSLTGNPA